MNRDTLAERWQTPDGRELADAAVRWLISGRGGAPSGLTRHQGRVDLRGLVFPSARVVASWVIAGYQVDKLANVVEIRGARWSGVDLSGAQLEHLRFFGAELDDCLFVEAGCGDWRLWKSRVRRCSFAGADLRSSVIGSWHEGRGNSWVGVSFDGADLRKAVMRGSLVEGCSFAAARLGPLHFQQMTLQDCLFAGPLKRVLFDCRTVSDLPRPGPMKAVDFGSAQFEDVEFRGCHFDGVVWPEQDGLRLVPRYPATARRALQLLQGVESDEARGLRAILENRLKLPGDEDSTGVFNHPDYVRMRGEAFASFVWDVLDRAEGHS